MAFSFRRSITIDHTKVGSTDQINFPVLISGTYSYLATVANGGKVTSSSGYDIIFYSDAALTTKLDHEIEVYTAASGLIVMWVRVPTISHTTDTVIYVGYGDLGVTTDQSNKTGVWNSAFKAMWHLRDGSTLSGSDSTSIATTLTNHSATATTGKIDGGAAFVSASSQYMDAASAPISTYPFTLEGWIKLSGTLPIPVTEGRAIVGLRNSGTNDLFWIDCFGGNSGDVLRTLAYDGTTLVASEYAFSFDTNWHYVVGVFTNATTQSLYCDGVALTATFSTGGTVTPSGINAVDVGRRLTSYYMQGALDDLGMSNVARPADWNLARFNSSGSPSTFYSVSGETAFTVFSSAGIGAAALIGKALFNGVFSSSGTGTASLVSSATSTTAFSSAGIGAASLVGKSLAATVFSSVGTGTADFVAFTPSVFSAAGIGSLSIVGLSLSKTIFNSDGAGSLSITSRSTATTVFSSSGLGTATVVGKSLFKGIFSSVGTSTCSIVGSAAFNAVFSSTGLGTLTIYNVVLRVDTRTWRTIATDRTWKVSIPDRTWRIISADRTWRVS